MIICFSILEGVVAGGVWQYGLPPLVPQQEPWTQGWGGQGTPSWGNQATPNWRGQGGPVGMGSQSRYPGPGSSKNMHHLVISQF
jgi:hypothetical protein